MCVSVCKEDNKNILLIKVVRGITGKEQTSERFSLKKKIRHPMGSRLVQIPLFPMQTICKKSLQGDRINLDK